MTTVFIDGREGTTGLRIYERLREREDISLITLSEDKRKDPACRKEALNSCDIAYLCLPDAAAEEAANMVENPSVKLIDASTAHRTSQGWVYGFPELSKKQEESIAASKRVAVPGCHASGFIALIAPLIASGALDKNALLSATSLTGYSGGGKKMIAQYQAEGAGELLESPRAYGLTQQHKHLKEMQAVCGLANAPAFIPIVSDFYSGMCVMVPVFAKDITGDIEKTYASLYGSDGIVSFKGAVSEEGFLASNALSGKDSMEIYLHGNEQRLLLAARFDNLGKGASGAAIECMNIMTGKQPGYGLQL